MATLEGDTHFSRATSLGTLSPVTDTILLKIFGCLDAKDLVLSCGRVSWMFNVVHNADELWKYLVLLHCIDPETKFAHFTFKGSWKATMLMPRRLLGNPPADVTSDEGSKLWRHQNIKAHQFQVAYAKHNGNVPGLATSSDINLITTAGDILRPPKWARIRQQQNFRWYNIRGMDIAKFPMFLGGVDRRHKLTVEEFREQYEKPNKPVLMTGMIDHWKAMKSWRFDEFVKKHADVHFKTNGRSSDGRRFRMKMFDFMSYCDAWNGEKPLYIFDKKILVNEPELLNDYDVLPHFQEDLFEEMDEDDRPDYRWILIGPNGSGSPLHTDPHNSSAWNAVIEGCKRVTFYPPDVIPPGVDEELIHSDYYASDDTMDWYRNTLPDLEEHERPTEVLVQPGEVLFIPSGWWHTVQNIGHTIAVTQNFCSTITFPRVVEDMNNYAGRGVRKDFKLALRDSDKWNHLASAIDTKKKAKC